MSGAYPPATGKQIPTDLLEIGTIDVNENVASNKPNGFQLSQNFPNHFNPTTEISFSLEKTGYTTLIVYNVLGQLIDTLIDQEIAVGTYHITFEAKDLPFGIYFYQIRSGEFTQVKKMMLMK